MISRIKCTTSIAERFRLSVFQSCQKMAQVIDNIDICSDEKTNEIKIIDEPPPKRVYTLEEAIEESSECGRVIVCLLFSIRKKN